MHKDDAASLYVGVMSGTSLDGIDVAITDLSNPEPTLLYGASLPLPKALKKKILALHHDQPHALHHYATLNQALGKTFADAINQSLAQANLNKTHIQAIGCHGQTLRHAPQAARPYTLQIGCPHSIAHQTGITTVADFRQRDITQGGQGAPLAPLFHHAFFMHPQRNRWMINIGGMANVTYLPAAQQANLGFDSGPGNVLMDAWMQQHHPHNFDRDGAWAASGTCNDAWVTHGLNDPYFQLPAPKSTGRDDFDTQWIEAINRLYPDTPQNIQRSLCELTAQSIAQSILKQPAYCQHDEIIVCGGGGHNAFLMQRLEALFKKNLLLSTACGIDADFCEAMGFAWLAQQRMQQRRFNLNQVTGAQGPVLLGVPYTA